MNDLEQRLAKKANRPVISSITFGSEFNPLEKFQNEILRPILKIQNKLLLSFFLDYTKSKNKEFDDLSDEKKETWIDSIFSKDLAFKNTLTGLILGVLENQEFSVYLEHKTELNKRILQMAKQRIKDNLGL